MGNRQSRKKSNKNASEKDSQSKSLKSTTTAPKSTSKKPPIASSKTSLTTSNVDNMDNPKNRLLLVTFGFIRTSVDVNRFNQIPIAIIQLCSKWIFQIGPNDICIKFSKYYYDWSSIPMAIELSLDDKNNGDINFFDKIFDNTLIQKYQINYIKIERNEMGDGDNREEFVEQKIASGLLNSVIAPVNSINDSKCYAFTFSGVVSRGSSGNMLVQVNAMDEKDCIILSSQWRVMNANVASVTHEFERHNDEAVEKYWNEYIIDNNLYEKEKKNRNCVIMDEWINAMKKSLIITDENDARLLFWFILFNNKSSLNEMKVEDLKEFLFDGSYQEYATKFYYPSVAFRNRIPNLTLPLN